VALLIYLLLPIPPGSIILYLIVAAGFLLGIWATGRLVRPGDPDPREAVWDEFVGMWATCLLLPKSLPWMAAAFVCFRALDVWKPWPARRLEGLPGGLGIMADDLMVGFYGATSLNTLRLVFFS
jgi:phosphatidylglycerophosphatase A